MPRLRLRTISLKIRAGDLEIHEKFYIVKTIVVSFRVKIDKDITRVSQHLSTLFTFNFFQLSFSTTQVLLHLHESHTDSVNTVGSKPADFDL
jgi:hypothetical protein